MQVSEVDANGVNRSMLVATRDITRGEYIGIYDAASALRMHRRDFEALEAFAKKYDSPEYHSVVNWLKRYVCMMNAFNTYSAQEFVRSSRSHVGAAFFQITLLQWESTPKGPLNKDHQPHSVRKSSVIAFRAHLLNLLFDIFLVCVNPLYWHNPSSRRDIVHCDVFYHRDTVVMNLMEGTFTWRWTASLHLPTMPVTRRTSLSMAPLRTVAKTCIDCVVATLHRCVPGHPDLLDHAPIFIDMGDFCHFA